MENQEPVMDFTLLKNIEPDAQTSQDKSLPETTDTVPKNVEAEAQGKIEKEPYDENTGVIPPPKACTTGDLFLSVVEATRHHPIENLALRVLIQEKVMFTGMTDAKGQIPAIEGIKIGSTFKVEVKKDAGSYKFVALGKIQSGENVACLESPKTRFEFATYSHAGSPGLATQHKQKVIQTHNQKPAEKPEITGNPEKKPEIKTDRDDQGNPKATVSDGLRDWFGRNALSQGRPQNDDDAIKHVEELIEFAETQAAWRYDDKVVSESYIAKMRAKTFTIPPNKGAEGYPNSIGRCTKYVKIALWKAGYGPATESIGKNIVPAREMGLALENAGFKNVTNQLPDARWAAPGDVIVYQRIGAANAAGHIDIRTYDGYISDFIGHELPVRRFKIIGIYRKFSDLIPERRMRAFLMVIASRESEQIFKADGYSESYRTVPGNKKEKFSGFGTHPFNGMATGITASGAYGITVDTWRRYTPFLQLSTGEEVFSPKVQDRIAITIMEQNHNALALVRKGKIEAAANSLATKKYIQWPSLPDGSQSRGFTATQMMDVYEKFLMGLK